MIFLEARLIGRFDGAFRDAFKALCSRKSKLDEGPDSLCTRARCDSANPVTFSRKCWSRRLRTRFFVSFSRFNDHLISCIDHSALTVSTPNGSSKACEDLAGKTSRANVAV